MPAQAHVARVNRRGRQHHQRHCHQQPGQPVGTIDHVDRIDDAHRRKHGERHREIPQRQAVQAEHRPDLLHPHPGPVHHDQRGQHLGQDAPVPAQVVAVVGQAHPGQQHRRHRERHQRISGETVHRQHANHNKGRRHGQPPGDRGRMRMVLAALRVIQKIQPRCKRVEQLQCNPGDGCGSQSRQHPCLNHPIHAVHHSRCAFRGKQKAGQPERSRSKSRTPPQVSVHLVASAPAPIM